MGQVFGIARGVVINKIQRFNVENRAERVISQDKPKAAPKFKSNLKDLERLLKDHPEIIEQLGKKDAELDDRLKRVFVSSSDYLEQRRKIDPEKPLPVNRKHVEDFELGYKETDPKQIPLGKCTLRQAVQFIGDFRQKPEEWTAEKISSEFKMKRETVDDILENFRLFDIHIPTGQSKTKKYFIDPFHRDTANFKDLLHHSSGKAQKEIEEKQKQENK